jgi:long-chain acyl-CoA synthetase
MSYSDKELNDFDSLSIDIDDLAALIFTSGTTGASKAVMLSQRNVCSAIEGALTALPEDQDGITLALLPLHYVYQSLNGLLVPLSRGVAIAFAEGIRSTMQNLKEISPTSIVCTPAVLEKLYKKIRANIEKREIEEKVLKITRATDSIKIRSLRLSAKKKAFEEIHRSFGGRLKYFMIGGAPADNEAVHGMEAFGFTVVQSYGLAETVSLIAMTPKEPKASSAIGSVISVGELKIADADGNGIGEVCYRGDNVMLGYYKQDALNKEVKQNGWIHTGDLGFIDADGYLTVIGRKKNAISALGKRWVYPEELETLILRNGYAKECAVIGIKNEDKGANDVVAVIYPDYTYAKERLGLYSSRPMIREKLGSAIADINTRLPAHKKISYFILLDEEIPKNAYKKIERSTLPEYTTREYLAFEN